MHLQPFSWSWGQAHPTQNEFSWTNLSSILFVEQPVGTGFSQGTPDVTVRAQRNVWDCQLMWLVCRQNEDQVAAEVVGFMQQFLDVFKELQGKKLYVTGESVSANFNATNRLADVCR